MDVFNEELLNFWKALQDHEVRYLMVGGVATNLHGFQRTTEVIDMWLEDTLENRKRMRKAFREYGMGDLETIERMQFVPGWTYFHLNNGLRLDIVVAMKGLEDLSFDDCYRMAYKATIHEVDIPFLHINHLLANKRAVNRPKDQADVAGLESIQQIEAEKAQRKP